GSDPVVEIRCAEKSGPGVRAGHVSEGKCCSGVSFLQDSSKLKGCPETPPASLREHGDAGEALQCGIQTCRLTSVQQRCTRAELSKHPPDSGTAAFGPYQPCLLSVREISGVNRAAESLQAQYTVKQGKATTPIQPQRQSVHSAAGERPYSCSLCLKGFISPSHLNMHMRVHTGERPYCCPQCGMRFAQKGNLRAHQRQVHQGKRPFPCPECGKRFTKRGNLRTHQQQVHLGKRPFPCTECGKGYFSQKDLKTVPSLLNPKSLPT
uniref:C2H2-type domain-containing protein n=1 Tax=Scleropages formosus TaxID=113540 RepID=A0A8C9WC12_SCLFO